MLTSYFSDDEVPVRRTGWPQAPENLRGVLDAFQDCAGFIPRDSLRTQWIAGARNFVENVGERPDLIRPSVEYMQERQLLIKSPGSLVTVAMKLRETTKPKNYRVCKGCGAPGGLHNLGCELYEGPE